MGVGDRRPRLAPPRQDRGPPSSKGLCVLSPACPRARSALPQLRQTPEAPQPLWGQTQIVLGPAARPVTLGTKLNRLTSPDRCAATGSDYPSPSPRPGAEVAIDLETVGRGGDGRTPACCPRRPSWARPRPYPALELPPGSQSCSSPRRKRRRLASGRSAGTPLWPQCGPQPAGISLPERGLCSLSPF